jgi:hypothetical protein
MTPIKARGNLTYRGRERVPLLYLTSVFSDVDMIYSIAIYLIEAYGCFSDVDMIYSITIKHYQVVILYTL